MEFPVDLGNQLTLSGGLLALSVLTLIVLPVERLLARPRALVWVAGTVFGWLALVGMLFPVDVALGVVLDFRNAMAAVCTYWFGPWAGMLTVLLAAVCKVWLGEGRPELVVGQLLTAWQIAWLWRAAAKHWPRMGHLAAVGGMAITVPLLEELWELALPVPLQWQLPHAQQGLLLLTFMATVLLLSAVVHRAILRAQTASQLNAQTQTLLRKARETTEILAATKSGQWTYDVQADRVHCIGEFYVQFGIVAPSTLSLAQWQSFLGARDEVLSEEMVRSLNEGRRDTFEVVQRLKSIPGNDWVWIRAAGRVTERGADGAVLRLVGLHQDISEQRHTEQALQVLQAKFASVFQALPEMAGIVRLRDGQCLDVNPAFYRVTGYRPDEVIHRSPDDLHLLQDSSLHEHLLSVLNPAGAVRDPDVRILHRDGSVVPGRVSAHPMDLAGEPCAVFLFTELTREKAVEASLAQKNALLAEAMARTNTILQLTPDPLSITRDSDHAHLEFNDAWCALTGYTREQALGKTALELGLFSAQEIRTYRRIPKTAETEYTGHHTIVDKQGQPHPGVLKTRRLMINGELCWMHAFHDLSDVHRSEALLQEREEILTLAIESAGLGYWSLHVQRQELSANAIWAALHGMNDVQFPISVEQWLATVPLEERGKLYNSVASQEAGTVDRLDVIHRVVHANGDVRYIRAIGQVVEWTPEGKRLRMSGINIDVTSERERELQLHEMAHYDALTKLPNRVELADRMKRAMAQVDRSGGLLGVVYMDLDGFKPVNDRWGHSAGDQLLVEIARRLKEALRPTDAVARLGGDEFVLLLEGLKSVQDAELALQRVIDSVAVPYLIQSEPVRVTASLGLTLYPPDKVDADTLLRHADQAMYRAKQAGRNRCQAFMAE